MPNDAVVLFVDDNPDRLLTLRQQFNGIDVVIRDPDDVSLEDLETAALVMMDFRLVDWAPNGCTPSLAHMPPDGIALSAVFRGHLRATGETVRPTAFALHSGHLTDLTMRVPAETREHVIARSSGVEWVFDKGSPLPDMAAQVSSLARAVKALPDRWPAGERSEHLVRDLLAATGHRWMERCWLDALSCQPPVHRMSQRSHGLAFLRWLLHRVLPYECFLWSDARLALRLGVTKADLTAAIEADGKLFQTAIYRGVLGDFTGRRWWRSAIESDLWERMDGNPDEARLAGILEASLGRAPVALEGRPVICVGDDLRFMPDPQPSSICVRLEPDDWPSYADAAWTTKEMAETHADLKALVSPKDRWWE